MLIALISNKTNLICSLQNRPQALVFSQNIAHVDVEYNNRADNAKLLSYVQGQGGSSR